MNYCLMDKHCVVYDANTGLCGVAHYDPLCQGCENSLVATFNQLRLDYVDLTQLLPPADARNEAGKIFRPKPESRPNMNISAFALRGEIAWTVAVVANAVRETTGTPRRQPSMPVREGFGLDCDLRYLEPRAADLAGLRDVHCWPYDSDERYVTDGPAIIVALRTLHSRARRMCGTQPKILALPGNCPFCRLATFRRHDDDENNIWCAKCRRKYTAHEYGRAVRLQWPITRNPTE